jgi:hypothetical protein
MCLNFYEHTNISVCMRVKDDVKSVKLSIWLINRHDLKTFGIIWIGYISTLSVVSFTIRRLYSREKFYWNWWMGLSGPQSKSGCSNKEKNLYSYQQSNPCNLAHILITTLTVAWLIAHMISLQIGVISFQVPPKRRYLFTRIHGVISRKTGSIANSCCVVTASWKVLAWTKQQLVALCLRSPARPALKIVHRGEERLIC